ncbi:MAG: hypothetical protein Q9207_001709 [Kuettlingeria erythrocarpa]
MVRGLPEGLVTTSDGVQADIETFDRVDVEDVVRLWKAYHTNSALLAEGVGQRLENFFWRIWSNPRLLDELRGSLVAAIFGKISEGGYIRTTPTQSPRSSRSLGAVSEPRQLEERSATPRFPLPSSRSECGDLLDDSQAAIAEETETEKLSSSRKRLPPRPPLILKRIKQASLPPRDKDRPLASLPSSPPAIGSYSSSSSSNLALADAQAATAKSAQRSTKTARFDRDEVGLTEAVPPKKLVFEMGEKVHSAAGKQMSGRKKMGVVASTGSSKRRPVMRQRSSQSSPSSASIDMPSRLGLESLPTERRAAPSLPANIRGNGRADQSPIFAQRTSGDKGGVIEKRSNLERTGSSHSADKVEPAPPGFHSVVSTRPAPSRTSFNSILKKPSTVTAASASYQATGIMDFGQGSSSQGRSLTTSSPDAAIEDAPPPLSGASRPVTESTGKAQVLPSTKSQLTILLERARGNGKSSNDR